MPAPEGVREPANRDSVTDWNTLQYMVNGSIPQPYQEDDAAWQEYEQLEETPVDATAEDRTDLRDVPAVTIDPAYAHDHDDGISLVEDAGGYRLYAHIADVTHFVEPDGAIAEAALDRGVTFYLGDNTRHMLPPPLAQEYCSLQPGEPHRALTIEGRIDAEGRLEDVDVYRSVVDIDTHLTYDDVDAVLDEDGDADVTLERMVEELDTVTAWMRQDRLDSSLILNPDDATGSRIVEECMVTANNATGRYVRDEGLDAVYRVEPAPSDDWMKAAARKLEKAGLSVPDDWEQGNEFRTVNEYFAQDVPDDKHQEAIKAVVTNLERARYKPQQEPHFGLGLDRYVQTTSPIRRGADLAQHWILTGDWEDADEDLIDVALRVTGQQRSADLASFLWHDAHT